MEKGPTFSSHYFRFFVFFFFAIALRETKCWRNTNDWSTDESFVTATIDRRKWHFCGGNESKACIPLCCPRNTRMLKNRCVHSNETFGFPRVYDAKSFSLTNLTVNDVEFRFFVHDPCIDKQKYKLNPVEYEEDSFLLLNNGSIYLSTFQHIVDVEEYCFGNVDHPDELQVVQCFDDASYENDASSQEINPFFPVGMIISVPFLAATFLVYSIVPELRNMHGCTLRNYVASLVVAYLFLAILQILPQDMIADTCCIVIALVIHFSFLASFFWLNVMCFDIWWTFGGFRTLRGSVKQREQKKFIMYSMYAWGSASVLSAVCIIMDFIPNIPKSFIRPMFGQDRCWFNNDEARAIYFYGPMGITVFCNICLFVSTALKISRHKKDTAHHLKGSESRRHDDNKQWFNLYLKLFIVMGINWSMEIVSWLFDGSLAYVWYITDLANTLQGLIIFVIFVWKEKTKRLLLKRFGCHRTNNFLSRNSTRSAYNSSTSRTYTSSVGTSLQEKTNHYTKRTRSDLFSATANTKEPDIA